MSINVNIALELLTIVFNRAMGVGFYVQVYRFEN